MANSASGITIPGDDPTTTAATPLQAWFNNLARSMGGRLPRGLANAAALTSYLSALAAEGTTPSATSPVIARQGDTGEWLENAGSGWVPLAPRAYAYTARLASPVLVGVATMSDVLTLQLPVAAPAGVYLLDAVWISRSDAAATQYRRVLVGATELAGTGDNLDTPGGIDVVRALSTTFTRAATGATLDIKLGLQINGGSAPWNRAKQDTHVRAVWLGRA